MPPDDRVPVVGQAALHAEFTRWSRAVPAVLLRLDRACDGHDADELSVLEPAAKHRPVRILPADAIGRAAGFHENDLYRVFHRARFVTAEAVAPSPRYVRPVRRCLFLPMPDIVGPAHTLGRRIVDRAAGRRDSRRGRSNRRSRRIRLPCGDARLRIEAARGAAARREVSAQRSARRLAGRTRPERPFPPVAAHAELRAAGTIPIERVRHRRSGTGRQQQGTGQNDSAIHSPRSLGGPAVPSRTGRNSGARPSIFPWAWI